MTFGCRRDAISSLRGDSRVCNPALEPRPPALFVPHHQFYSPENDADGFYIAGTLKPCAQILDPKRCTFCVLKAPILFDPDPDLKALIGIKTIHENPTGEFCSFPFAKQSKSHVQKSLSYFPPPSSPLPPLLHPPSLPLPFASSFLYDVTSVK